MARDRELAAVYALLGNAFVHANPYDPKGAFILLHSISEGLGDATPMFVDVASHVHMIAALGGSDLAADLARKSMVRLVAILEGRATSGVLA